MASKMEHLHSEGLFPRPKRPEEQVIGLAMGILTQAVRDLIRPQRKIEKDCRIWQDDAEAWFASSRSDTGSFLWICEVLQMKPEGLREWLKHLRKAAPKKQKSVLQSLLRMTYRNHRPL